MSKTYDVLVRVPATKLATIIETLDGEGELLSVNTTTPITPTHKRNVVSRKKLGITGLDLAVEVTKGGGDISREQIEAAFIAKGFKKNSVSPVLSKHLASGRLVEVRKGVYKIALKK